MCYPRIFMFLTIIACCLVYFTILEYEIVTFNGMIPSQYKISTKIAEPSRNFNYVTVSCNTGRLGNQIWAIITGWGISKRLNRKLYMNCHVAHVKKRIEMLRQVFPKLGGTFEQFKPQKEVSLMLTNQCCTYKDPSIFSNRSEKYLRLRIGYGQNARYFYEYRDELDHLFEFGAETTDNGEMIIQKRGLTNVTGVLCAHIRQTDFRSMNWDRPIEECLAVIEHIAKMNGQRTFLLFGDDKQFMSNLTTKLVKKGVVLTNSFYSNYTEAEDLYLSNRLCETFVATSEASSFGFWLSYLSGHPDSVYYINEDRGGGRPKYDEQFPLPWHAVRVVNGTVRIS